jgi:putative membrane protein insertion efficiency factor
MRTVEPLEARTHPSPRGGGRAAHRARPSGLARVVLLPVRFYQRVISPALPRRCKYHPTCSDYAVQAVSRYGILRGGALAGWRLLRCNPWSHGGYDPVSAQTLFRRPPRLPQPPSSDS